MRYRNPYISKLGKQLRFPAFGRSLFRPRSRGFHRYVPQVDCPERDAKVWFDECVRCRQFQVWHSADGDFKRCFYEFKDLEARGHYDEEKWLSYLEKTDPETFAEIQEERRNRERVWREMEAEKAELARLAEELARDDDEDDEEQEDEEHAQDDKDEEEDEY
jgi:hypothetical protein